MPHTQSAVYTAELSVTDTVTEWCWVHHFPSLISPPSHPPRSLSFLSLTPSPISLLSLPHTLPAPSPLSLCPEELSAPRELTDEPMTTAPSPLVVCLHTSTTSYNYYMGILINVCVCLVDRLVPKGENEEEK